MFETPPRSDAYVLDLPESATAAARVTEIKTQLSEIAQRFRENLLHATQAWTRHVPDESLLAGLPQAALQQHRRVAQAAGVPGALLTLDLPSYRAAISSLEDRQLRKELYEARATRASDRGPRAGDHDNAPLVLEALALRHELARLHGKDNYADLMVQRGDLIRSADDVERFLKPRARALKPRAQAELDALWAFARAEGVPKGFSMWDLPYYAARLRQRELGIASDQAELCAYFPLPSVQQGLFDAAAQLLGLQIVPLTAATTSEAECYRVLDEHGQELGTLEIEAIAHPHEREGARASLGGSAERPTLRLQLGLPAPQGSAFALLTPEEVRAAFNAWGQGLHRLLAASAAQPPAARHEAATASLICGGLFERLALHPPMLQGFARHAQTGDALSSDVLEKLQRSQELHAGLAALEHLEQALFDLRLHRDYVPAGKSTQLRSHVLDTLGQVRRELSVMPPPYWERMANRFTRVFVDGRGARVWEEIWAEQMAADLLHALTASGFSFERTRSLRELLWAREPGGLAARTSDWLKRAAAPAA